ncbi:MAG: sigma 54-interacting transcriptional regulator [Thermoanaerobaculia bacterium]
MDPGAFTRVLSEVAETASETLELQEVFERVASSIRQIIPLDHMGIVRLLPGGLAEVHASTVPCEGDEPACQGPEPLESWSPRLRPRPGPIARLDDAPRELDPAFPVDADILEAGVRSALWEPFRLGESFLGGVWVSSYAPGTFTDEHQELLRPIAALLGSAVEHWRIWDVEMRRGERLDRVEALADVLAESLDVAEVFDALSTAVQPIVPHDVLALSELAGDRAFRVVALAGETPEEVPEGLIALSEGEASRRFLEFEIVRDVEDLPADSERNRLVLANGMRSWLRVPVRLWGEVSGSLVFFSRERGRYAEEDVEVASRIADRIALAIAHQRLADEARVAAEARERAERLTATVETLTRQLEERERMRIVGVSRSWKDVLQQVGRVASAETTVLITGESGTGKEVVSRLIHQGSRRSSKPFVAINCAALPEQLLESELFGHEKGAFTGAVATKIGHLEQAEGGTLFLDEIGEMSPLVQAKLLRVLQERTFQRLGATKTLRADVRLIAATNRDLAAAMARAEFREDLYYRLNVFEICVPPLRDRPEDILVLAERFLEELGRTSGRPAAGISREAREWLLDYPWPGNVRELRNAIERAILLCDGGLVTRQHLPAVVGRPEEARAATNGNGAALPALPAGGVDLDDVERGLVEQAMRQTRGNKSRAAKLLGLTRSQLYTRLEKYGLR